MVRSAGISSPIYHQYDPYADEGYYFPDHPLARLCEKLRERYPHHVYSTIRIIVSAGRFGKPSQLKNNWLAFWNVPIRKNRQRAVEGRTKVNIR